MTRLQKRERIEIITMIEAIWDLIVGLLAIFGFIVLLSLLILFHNPDDDRLDDD